MKSKSWHCLSRGKDVKGTRVMHHDEHDAATPSAGSRGHTHTHTPRCNKLLTKQLFITFLVGNKLILSSNSGKRGAASELTKKCMRELVGETLIYDTLTFVSTCMEFDVSDKFDHNHRIQTEYHIVTLCSSKISAPVCAIHSIFYATSQ